MATTDSIRKWIRRHVNKHLCMCGCKEFIEIKHEHHRRGIPKFIKGHNFSSDHNPKVDAEVEDIKRSPSWDILSEEEKNRRISCLKKFGSMEEHPSWKGGRVYDEDGYVRIRNPEHPFANDGYVLEHRQVMESFLREQYPNSHYLVKVSNELYLKQEVVVHHIDEIKDNNDLSNLFPFPDAAAHSFWHKSSLPDSEKIKRIKSGVYRTEWDGEDKHNT